MIADTGENIDMGCIVPWRTGGREAGCVAYSRRYPGRDAIKAARLAD